MKKIISTLLVSTMLVAVLAGCSQKKNDTDITASLGFKAFSEVASVESSDKAQVNKTSDEAVESGLNEYYASAMYYFNSEDDANSAKESYIEYLTGEGFVETAYANGDGYFYQKSDLYVSVDEPHLYNDKGANNGKYFVVVVYSYNE